MTDWNETGVDDEEDALQPAFALLQEIEHGEGRFFVHFSFDEVERIAFGEGAHRKEAVLGDGTVNAVVERDVLFSLDLEMNRGKLNTVKNPTA